MSRSKLLVLAVLLYGVTGTVSARHRSHTIADAIADALTDHRVDPDAPVVVGFSPGVNGYRAEDVVVQAINEAQTSVHVAAYSFTSKPIAAALVAAKRRNLDVRIVADEKSNGRKYSAATFCANEGVPVRLDGNYSIMHNKFIVVDDRNVETGSFNYTTAAAKHNAENALLLRKVPELAAKYQQEWQRLWDESAELPAQY